MMIDDEPHTSLATWDDIPAHVRERWMNLINEIPLPPASFGSIASTINCQLSFDEWVHLISADPVLGGKILAVVNTAARGLTHPLTDIHRAVVHLGLSLTRIVVLGYYVEGLLARWKHYPKQHFSFIRQWSACAAILAFSLAKTVGLVDAGTLSTAALLSHLGGLVLGLDWPGPGQDYRLQPDERARLDYEQATWQITTPALSSALLRQWGVPEPLPELATENLRALYDELEPGPRSVQLTILTTATVLAADFLRDPDSVGEQLSAQPCNQVLLGNVERLGLMPHIQTTLSNPKVHSELELLTK